MAASELNTPTEPATPPVPPLSWPHRSPHGSNVVPDSISSGTIPIEVQPPSRPTSIISPTQEDVMLLSPNSRLLQLGSNPSTHVQPTQLLSPRSLSQYQHRLESEQPGFVPVIPDMLDGDEGIQLMNFGAPGFVPISIVKTNTSEVSSQSTAESDRRCQGRGGGGGRGGLEDLWSICIVVVDDLRPRGSVIVCSTPDADAEDTNIW
ncbi:hypothetical protein E4T56_gene6131 [Termitomyces sp. T112]|nr:hypothetical protein E4T56_gene6131 [Termitomyces sp. T112]